MSMVNGKSWDEFRSTGLLLIINQILHIFGWAIVTVIDDDGNVTNCYPARVKFRGFSNDSTEKAYAKVSKWMKENSDVLYEEAISKN